MLHISKTATGQFIVVRVSDKNGKVLHSSEPFKTKRSAIANIVSFIKDEGFLYSRYQDNTKSIPFILSITASGSLSVLKMSHKKPYVPAGVKKLRKK